MTDRTVTIKGRLAQRPDLPSEDAGSAAPDVPSSFAAIDRVKEQTASLDQAELMAMIDNEVEAVRAARSRRNPPTAECPPRTPGPMGTFGHERLRHEIPVGTWAKSQAACGRIQH